MVGDTLASALLANGVHLVGRSFKYHRWPRGILSANTIARRGGTECAGQYRARRARKTPNVRATVQELYDGLKSAFAEPLAIARLRFRRGQRARCADVFRRLLLQDLHVAEGRGSGSTSPTSASRPVSALRPINPIRIIMPAVSPIAMCWCSAAALPVSLRRLRRRNLARVIVADEQAEFGGALRFESGARH
jgi:sarcosine oxidase subunit alpha